MTSRVSESTKHQHPPGHESDRPSSSSDPESSIPARILIVDDDPIVLTAMEMLLDGPNRIIVKAETGQDALRHLLRHDFAVVLLDVRMPRLDGYETAALVRQRERSRYTPIIFLSGVDTLDADVIRGLTSGAVDYLVKPVVPEILKNKVSVFVDLYRLRERVKQQAVRQSEERFRLLVEGVQDYAIFLLDREGLVTTWNIGAERLTGYRVAEILGRHYECFYPNEELASGQPACDLQTAAAEGSRAEQDRWMVRKDSTRFIANVVVTGLRDEPGNLQGYAVVIRDVTERREAEAATARLAAIVASSDDAIVSLNLDGIVTSWNHGAEKLFGFGTDEMLGQPIQRLIPSGRVDEEEKILSRIRRGDRIEHYETVRRHKSGRLIDVSLTASPMTDSAGTVIGASKISRDITERKRTEEALHRLTSELEQRVTERTSELVLMHDRLRAFAMQLNLTEQRERRRLASDLHDYLAQLLVVVRIKVMQAAQLIPDGRAVRLLKEADQAITQSLDYTRSLVTELAPPTLHDFGLLSALEWLASQMQRHGLAIVVKLNIDTLPLPEDQAVLIYQAVRELLFNVLKHAAANQATISVTLTPQKTLEVTVVDDGNGFDLAVITTPTIGSKCFGLFSIRERMEALGGRLELDSAVGQGTRATLVIPYCPKNEQAESLGTPQPVSTQHSEPSTENKLPLSAPAPLRVLLVDDHAMVRQGLRSLLEGHDDVQVVGEAGDGTLGIELAGSLNPDVVVMDVTMPRIDGIEATRRIRQIHPSIAVVGLSVHGTSQVEAAMKAAGASSFVSKESAGDELYEAILAAGSERNRG